MYMKHIVIFCNFENFNRIINEGIPKEDYYKTLITVDKSLIEKCKDIYHQIFYIEENHSSQKDLPTDNLDRLLDDIHSNRAIDGIFCESEYMVEKIARYRSRYNIRYGLKGEDAIYFRNKVLMKDIIKKNTTVNIPRYRTINSEDDVKNFLNNISDIAIIKPVDGAGTLDTFKVSKDNYDEVIKIINDNFDKYEIEEFIEGEMYHIDTIIYDGNPVFTSVGKYLLSTMECHNSNPYVGYMYPNHEDKLIGKLVDTSNQVLAGMPIKEGVTHMELFLTNSGEVYFCEVAARIAGSGIIFAIEDTCGINPLCQGAQAFVGINPDMSKRRQQENGGYVILYKKSGKITDISETNDFIDIPGIRTITILYKKDDVIEFNGSSGDVAGVITWVANSFDDNSKISSEIVRRWRIETSE